MEGAPPEVALVLVIIIIIGTIALFVWAFWEKYKEKKMIRQISAEKSTSFVPFIPTNYKPKTLEESKKNHEMYKKSEYLSSFYYGFLYDTISVNDIDGLKILLDQKTYLVDTVASSCDHPYSSLLHSAILGKNKEMLEILLNVGFYFIPNEKVKPSLDWIFENISEEVLFTNVKRACLIESISSQIKLSREYDYFEKEYYEPIIKGKLYGDSDWTNKYDSLLKTDLKNFYQSYHFNYDNLAVFLAEKNVPDMLFVVTFKEITTFSAVVIKLSKHLNTAVIAGRTLFLHLLQLSKASNAFLSKISIVLREGADVTLADTSGNNILHYIALIEDVHLLNTILAIDTIKSPKLINALNMDNRTPLHLATLSNNKRVIQWLLTQGADISIKDIQGRTPTDIALLLNSERFIK